jgi:Xaa-Pro dipeptidase
MAKKSKVPEPKIIRPDDIDPNHDWKRPLQAPGHTQVDFEERVNFRRLHDYRLARTRAALADSGLGALLCFDQHNIRYTTSTVIGEWARDKLTRYSLLTGNGDPYIWDFGSAAKHHRLYTPWLCKDHCKAGLPGPARRGRRRRQAVQERRRARSRRCWWRRASPTCRSASTSSRCR